MGDQAPHDEVPLHTWRRPVPKPAPAWEATGTMQPTAPVQGKPPGTAPVSWRQNVVRRFEESAASAPGGFPEATPEMADTQPFLPPLSGAQGADDVEQQKRLKVLAEVPVDPQTRQEWQAERDMHLREISRLQELTVKLERHNTSLEVGREELHRTYKMHLENAENELAEKTITYEKRHAEKVSQFEQQLAQTQMKHERKLESLQDSHEKELKDLKRRHDTAFSDSSSQFESRLATDRRAAGGGSDQALLDLQKNYEMQLSDLKNENQKTRIDDDKRLNELTKKYEQQLTTQAAHYEKQLADITVHYERQLADTHADYQKRLDLATNQTRTDTGSQVYIKKCEDLQREIDSLRVDSNNRLSESQKHYEARIVDTTTHYEKQLASRTSAYERQIAELRDLPEILKTKHAKEVAENEKRFSSKLAEFASTHEARMEMQRTELTAAHAKEVAKLQEQIGSDSAKQVAPTQVAPTQVAPKTAPSQVAPQTAQLEQKIAQLEQKIADLKEQNEKLKKEAANNISRELPIQASRELPIQAGNDNGSLEARLAEKDREYATKLKAAEAKAKADAEAAMEVKLEKLMASKTMDAKFELTQSSSDKDLRQQRELQQVQEKSRAEIDACREEKAQALASLEKKQADDLKHFRERHEEDLKNIEKQYEERMVGLERELKKDRQVLQQGLEEREKHVGAMTEKHFEVQKAQYEKQIEVLQKGAQQSRDALKEQYDQQVELIRSSHQKELEALQRQVEHKNEAMEAQRDQFAQQLDFAREQHERTKESSRREIQVLTQEHEKQMSLVREHHEKQLDIAQKSAQYNVHSAQSILSAEKQKEDAPSEALEVLKQRHASLTATLEAQKTELHTQVDQLRSFSKNEMNELHKQNDLNVDALRVQHEKRIDLLQANARQTREAIREQHLQQADLQKIQHQQEVATLKRQLDQSTENLDLERKQLRQQLEDLQEESHRATDSSKRTLDAFKVQYERQLDTVRSHYEKQIEVMQTGTKVMKDQISKHAMDTATRQQSKHEAETDSYKEQLQLHQKHHKDEAEAMRKQIDLLSELMDQQKQRTETQLNDLQKENRDEMERVRQAHERQVQATQKQHEKQLEIYQMIAHQSKDAFKDQLLTQQETQQNQHNQEKDALKTQINRATDLAEEQRFAHVKEKDAVQDELRSTKEQHQKQIAALTQKHQKELESFQSSEQSIRLTAEQQAQERELQLQSKHAREVEMHRKTAESLQQQLEENNQQMTQQLNKIQAAANKNLADYQSEQEKAMEAQKAHHVKQINILQEGLKNAQEASAQHTKQQSELQASQHSQALTLHKKQISELTDQLEAQKLKHMQDTETMQEQRRNEVGATRRQMDEALRAQQTHFEKQITVLQNLGKHTQNVIQDQYLQRSDAERSKLETQKEISEKRNKEFQDLMEKQKQAHAKHLEALSDAFAQEQEVLKKTLAKAQDVDKENTQKQIQEISAGHKQQLQMKEEQLKQKDAHSETAINQHKAQYAQLQKEHEREIVRVNGKHELALAEKEKDVAQLQKVHEARAEAFAAEQKKAIEDVEAKHQKTVETLQHNIQQLNDAIETQKHRHKVHLEDISEGARMGATAFSDQYERQMQTQKAQHEKQIEVLKKEIEKQREENEVQKLQHAQKLEQVREQAVNDTENDRKTHEKQLGSVRAHGEKQIELVRRQEQEQKDALKGHYERELALQKNAHEKELEVQKAAHQQSLESIEHQKSLHTSQLRDQQEQVQKEQGVARDFHSQQLESLKGEHKRHAEMQQNEIDQQKALSESLKSKHEREVEELKQEKEREKEMFRKQVQQQLDVQKSHHDKQMEVLQTGSNHAKEILRQQYEKQHQTQLGLQKKEIEVYQNKLEQLDLAMESQRQQYGKRLKDQEQAMKREQEAAQQYHERQLELQAGQHKKEIEVKNAELAKKDIVMQGQQQKHANELVELRNGGKQDLDRVVAEHAKRVDDLQAEHGQVVAALNKTHKEGVESQKANYDRQLEILKLEHKDQQEMFIKRQNELSQGLSDAKLQHSNELREVREDSNRKLEQANGQQQKLHQLQQTQHEKQLQDHENTINQLKQKVERTQSDHAAELAKAIQVHSQEKDRLLKQGEEQRLTEKKTFERELQILKDTQEQSSAAIKGEFSKTQVTTVDAHEQEKNVLKRQLQSVNESLEETKNLHFKELETTKSFYAQERIELQDGHQRSLDQLKKQHQEERELDMTQYKSLLTSMESTKKEHVDQIEDTIKSAKDEREAMRTRHLEQQDDLRSEHQRQLTEIKEAFQKTKDVQEENHEKYVKSLQAQHLEFAERVKAENTSLTKFMDEQKQRHQKHVADLVNDAEKDKVEMKETHARELTMLKDMHVKEIDVQNKKYEQLNDAMETAKIHHAKAIEDRERMLHVQKTQHAQQLEDLQDTSIQEKDSFHRQYEQQYDKQKLQMAKHMQDLQTVAQKEREDLQRQHANQIDSLKETYDRQLQEQKQAYQRLDGTLQTIQSEHEKHMSVVNETQKQRYDQQVLNVAEAKRTELESGMKMKESELEKAMAENRALYFKQLALNTKQYEQMLADAMRKNHEFEIAKKNEAKDLRSRKKAWGLNWLVADQSAYLSLVMRAWRYTNQISGLTLHYEKLLEFQMSKYELALETLQRQGAEAEAHHQQRMHDTKAAYEYRLEEQDKHYTTAIAGVQDANKLAMRATRVKCKELGVSFIGKSMTTKETFFNFWRQAMIVAGDQRILDKHKAEAQKQYHEMITSLRRKLKNQAYDLLDQEARGYLIECFGMWRTQIEIVRTEKQTLQQFSATAEDYEKRLKEIREAREAEANSYRAKIKFSSMAMIDQNSNAFLGAVVTEWKEETQRANQERHIQAQLDVLKKEARKESEHVRLKMKEKGIALIETSMYEVQAAAFVSWMRHTVTFTMDRKMKEAQTACDNKLIEQEVAFKQESSTFNKQLNDLKEERAVLKKKLGEMSTTIRGEIGQDRLLKEQTRMQLEEFRTRTAVLFEENRLQQEELTSLRSKVLVSATETTWMWRTANEAMAAQRERLEKQNAESIQATKRGFEQQLADRTLRQQRELEGKIYDLEDECAHQKQVIKSLLEEQAETIAEDMLNYDRSQMGAEDQMSKCWWYMQRHDENVEQRKRLEHEIEAKKQMDAVVTKVATKENASQLDTVTQERDELKAAYDSMRLDFSQKGVRFAQMENELRQAQEALQVKEAEVQKLQVFCLQPSMPQPVPGKKSSKPEEQDLKGLMRGFLQELLKGKKMKLQTEGGGPPTPTILSITKDLKFLTMKVGNENYKIPMAQIQQVVPGKDLPANVWTSTPVDDNTVTIVFGPSTDDQHTAAFREDTIEERDKFVNSMKVLRLAMVQGQGV